jgi:hypothetical protein
MLGTQIHNMSRQTKFLASTLNKPHATHAGLSSRGYLSLKFQKASNYHKTQFDVLSVHNWTIQQRTQLVCFRKIWLRLVMPYCIASKVMHTHKRK